MACYLSSNATYRSTLQLKFTSGPNHFEEEYAHYEANPDHLKRIRIQLIYVTLFYFNKTINVIFIKSYWRNHSGSGKNILDSEKTFLIRKKTFLIWKKTFWIGKKLVLWSRTFLAAALSRKRLYRLRLRLLCTNHGHFKMIYLFYFTFSIYHFLTQVQKKLI